MLERFVGNFTQQINTRIYIENAKTWVMKTITSLMTAKMIVQMVVAGLEPSNSWCLFELCHELGIGINWLLIERTSASGMGNRHRCNFGLGQHFDKCHYCKTIWVQNHVGIIILSRKIPTSSRFLVPAAETKEMVKTVLLP